MLFNSIDFAIFLPIIFVLYWFVTNKKLQLQNTLLLVASYFFYAYFDWRFLFLLIFSTLLDFFAGLMISYSVDEKSKKFWFGLSIVINLGFLGVFKYYDFFALSFADGLSNLGIKTSIWTLHLILPVGISFYTFHGLSYIIDIYKNKIKSEKNFINYAVFVSYFPLLVAGPIERATHLLPQIKKKRFFDYDKAVDGLRQILWGLFKKIVVADQCANYANVVFNNSAEYSGSTLVLGAIFFAFQIYCDFSGYSDIALGTSRLFGIELLRNFSFPYFSRDIAEFWRRWHISLSSWFRDYLYIPLGGNRGNIWMKTRNIFMMFIISGFWHGANWTFIAWGALNAIYFLPLLITKSNRTHLDIVAQGKTFPNLKELLQMFTTFMLFAFSLILFRANDITHALSYIKDIFSPSLFSKPVDLPYLPILSIIICMVIEWAGRETPHAISTLGNKWPSPLKYTFYYAMIIAIIYFGGKEQQFIYFRF